MINPTFPGEAKIWVYQSNRAFTAAEENEIHDKLAAFFKTWHSDKAPVKSAAEVKYHRFIVIAADATNDEEFDGCVINESIVMIKSFEKEYSVSLLDRFQVAYRNNNAIHNIHLNEFKALLANRTLDENTIVFNNVITTKKAYEKQWEVPVKSSWHKMFLEVSA